MSGRDGVTIGLGFLVLLGLATLTVPRPGRRTARWPTQVLIGAACGVVGALIASSSYVDLVPDRLETRIIEAGALATMLVVLVTAHALRRARLRHPASNRRSPGASRSSTSRVHRGP